MSEYGSGATPQWAADPSGRHRYRWWDGEQWTGHVNDGPTLPRHAPRRRPQEYPEYPEYPGSNDPTVEHPTATRPRRAARGEGGGGGGDDGGGGGGVGGVFAGLDRPSFFKGAAAGGGLVAVIAILAMLALGGDDDGKTVTPKTTKRTTTTTEATTTTTILTTTTLPGRPPSQVRVIVLNGSGVSGAATKTGDALKAAGYTVLTLANTAERQGTVVECNNGFATEAQALATAVGQGATVTPAENPPPKGLDEADCVVILGTPATATT